MSQSASIAKVNNWHRELAVWLIANPTATNAETAKHFKVTEPWLSTVKNSDAFREYFDRVHAEHAKVVLQPIQDKLMATADAALGHIQNKVTKDGATMEVHTLLSVTDTLLKRAGVGEAKQPIGSNNPSQININLGLVSREQLEEARQAMRAPRAITAIKPVGLGGSPAMAETIDLQASDLPSSGLKGDVS